MRGREGRREKGHAMSLPLKSPARSHPRSSRETGWSGDVRGMEGKHDR